MAWRSEPSATTSARAGLLRSAAGTPSETAAALHGAQAQTAATTSPFTDRTLSADWPPPGAACAGSPDSARTTPGVAQIPPKIRALNHDVRRENLATRAVYPSLASALLPSGTRE